MLMANGASGLIAIDHGIKGPCFSVASACASGADGIGMAFMMLRAGMIDMALAGASECTVTSVGVAAFDRVGAMSRRNDDYSMTPAPFDRNRDGLVMGEGAAVLVLESESHATGARRQDLCGTGRLRFDRRRVPRDGAARKRRRRCCSHQAGSFVCSRLTPRMSAISTHTARPPS